MARPSHVTIGIIVLLCISHVMPITINVNPLDGVDSPACGSLDACKSITFAVEKAFQQADPMDIEIVLNSTAGPYTGPANWNVRIPPQIITSHPTTLNITSDDFTGASKAVIECLQGQTRGNGWRVTAFQGLLSLRGLEIRNCNASIDGSGGCLYFLDTLPRAEHASHRFEHIVLDSCSAYTDGGALWATTTTQLDFVDVKITNSELRTGPGALAARGGGAFIEITEPRPLFFERLVLMDNSVWGTNVDLQGGGLYVQNFHGNGTIEIQTATIANNMVDVLAKNDSSLGGGIFLSDTGGALVDVQFVNNTARYGGGIYYQANNQKLDLCSEATTVTQNVGFGVYVKQGEVVVWPDKLTGNVPQDQRAVLPGTISECGVPAPLTPQGPKRNSAAVVAAVIILIIAIIAGAAFGGYFYYKKRVAYRTV